MASIRVTPETLETEGNDLIGYGGDLASIVRLMKSSMDGMDLLRMHTLICIHL